MSIESNLENLVASSLRTERLIEQLINGLQNATLPSNNAVPVPVVYGVHAVPAVSPAQGVSANIPATPTPVAASAATAPSTPMTPSITLPSGSGSKTKVNVGGGLDYSKLILLPDTDRLDLNAPQNAASARLTAQANAYFQANPNIDRFTGAKINVTVNGAIDSEGTARTIVDVLNDSYYRGTIGASKLQGIN